ncbi:GntR family transcriptional regulator [Syntrophotalea acetylenivorans]|uniref:GntR family transcriptional regulator n=1 Tax=Syntrophotalea acetylenivorans TaxID=1842532 RepID=A0A1L3GRU0_9BACT|nr:PLP-dependent aminotransferase family protein [Syntrophotalea acetylenivorans]APG28378.1 GntR family transcriptional regulator [Syntrophotalea acetylenivorans]
MRQELFRYQEVERYVIDLIETSTVGPGERLPSLRVLSSRLKASISTINQAYLALEKQGVIEARSRSGFFVREQVHCSPPVSLPRPDLEPTQGNRSHLIQTVLSSVGDRNLLPLGVICPSEELLPSKPLARLMAVVTRENPHKTIAYETIYGNLELRRQLAFRALDAGMAVSPEGILITSGAMEALYVSLRAVTRPGDNVLIQSPTYYCFLQLLENCGLRAIEVPSRPENGVDPADVAKALQRFDISACIFSPNFNNPDGSLACDGAKKEVVELLAERDIPLIEDDVYGDLSFDACRPRTYQSFDRKGLVMLCSSFSKTIAPGYRVGWMIPGRFYRRALEVKTVTNVCSATPTQMAVAAYLRTGQYDRHLKRLRTAIQKQMQTMQIHLGRCFPVGTGMTRPRGGGVLWLELDESIDSVALFYRAREAGIGIAPGAIFSTQDKYNNFIRLSCGALWDEKLRQGLETLGSLIGEMSR